MYSVPLIQEDVHYETSSFFFTSLMATLLKVSPLRKLDRAMPRRKLIRAFWMNDTSYASSVSAPLATNAYLKRAEVAQTDYQPALQGINDDILQDHKYRCLTIYA